MGERRLVIKFNAHKRRSIRERGIHSRLAANEFAGLQPHAAGVRSVYAMTERSIASVMTLGSPLDQVAM